MSPRQPVCEPERSAEEPDLGSKALASVVRIRAVEQIKRASRVLWLWKIAAAGFQVD